MLTKKQARSIAFFIFLFTAFPIPAYAYVDPGTGSYILQILLAGLLAVPFAIKRYWVKIKNIFKSSK